MTSLWIALEDLAPQHQMLGVMKLYVKAKEVSHKDLKGFTLQKGSKHSRENTTNGRV
jgi:hypothetical protein